MVNRNPTKIFTNLEETEDEHSFPPWSDLPFPAIEKIYSFLNRTDQKNMSLVCRNWREEYSSPSLWRKITFCISELENNKKLGSFSLSRFLAAFFRCPCKAENYRTMCPEVVYARRFGIMCRQVEILFPKPPSLVTFPLPSPPHTVLLQLLLFLKAVTRRSRLQSISFKYMHLSFRDDEQELYSGVYRRILNLLKSQKNLRYVEFSYCRFKKAEAAKILKVILANNPETLRHLFLPAFFEEQNHDQLEDVAVGEELNYTTLMNLEILAMDYTRMFENMILSLYENKNRIEIKERKGRLRKITLRCDGYNAVNYSHLKPLVWDYLRNIFRGLAIVLLLISPCDSMSFSKYIVPGMPIRTLLFRSNFVDVQTTEIGPLLRHMISCSISKSIEEFRVIFKGVSPNLAQDLIILTNVCPKLKTLNIVVDHPVIVALETVFGRWLEKRPASLRAVKITLKVQTEQVQNIYSSLIDFYAGLLKPMKLIFSCVAGTEIVPCFTLF